MASSPKTRQIFDLSGRVAIVTGGSVGLGQQMAEGLAGMGANLVLCARKKERCLQTAEELQKLGVEILALGCDVKQPASIQEVVAAAVKKFGRIDILINNAAVRPHKPFTEVTIQDWEHVRGVVLDGALYCTQAAIGSMVENQYGRILFFTGEGAFTGGSGRAHVSAAKMGLVGLARALASEFAAQNIRANVVSPGSIDTRRDNPEWYQGRVPNAAGIPLGRQGHVDEIAATCLFLVSDAGGFITGQTIHVNGGTGYY
jgi:NAD(P)-dependent dehydrogenase (short-subunit alcohol dehydrogenase family)